MRVFTLASLLVLCATYSGAETNLAVYLGGAHTQDSNVTLRSSVVDQLTFADVPFAGHSFESPLYYGGRVGYYWLRHFGAEAEFIHLKLYAKTATPVRVTGIFNGSPVNTTAPMSNYAQRFSSSHGNNLVLFSGAYRQEFFRDAASGRLGKLLLTVRAGGGPTIPHAEVTFAGNSYESYFLGHVAVQIGAGAEWKVWHGLYLLGEYKFTHNAQQVDNDDKFLKVDANSHHGVFGISAHF